MIIAIDFDGTLVSQERDYDDVTSPLLMLPGALAALRAFKQADHTVLVYSARANRALRLDPMLDPLVRAGHRKAAEAQRWARSKPLAEARYRHMVEFCTQKLKGLVDAVDDGGQGKPMADLFIDDRAVCYGPLSWAQIAQEYGEPSE